MALGVGVDARELTTIHDLKATCGSVSCETDAVTSDELVSSG